MEEKKVPWYNQIEEWMLAICFGFMTAIVGANVIARFGFKTSIAWADQMGRIMFVWITMIGVSLAALKGTHLKVEALTSFLPRKPGLIVSLFGDFVSVVYAVVVCYFMWSYIANMLQFPQYFSAIPWLPATVMYIPGVMGMIGFIIRLFQGSIIPQIQELRGKRPGPGASDEEGKEE